MYRTAAKRVFLLTRRFHKNSNARLQFPTPHAFMGSSGFYISLSRPFSTEQPHNQGSDFPDSSSPSSSSTSSSSTWSTLSTAEGARHHETLLLRAKYQDEQARVFEASLPHVVRTHSSHYFFKCQYRCRSMFDCEYLKLGWTEAALIAGAREADLFPSSIGCFPRKEAGLVEAQPINGPTSFKQRAMLVDEIWHATGNNASDVDWHVKRTVLGGIYSTTKICMLTDSSPDFRDTWAFSDTCVKDAFGLKKTIQEAQYLAEAVGAGIGGSL